MPPLNNFTKSCLTLAIGKALLMPAQAAEIIVNNSGDVSANDDQCTLREAIVSANTNAANSSDGCVDGDVGSDTITFIGQAVDDGYVRLNSGLDTISEDLAIDGSAVPNGIQIYGGYDGRALDISSSNVSISDVQIAYGEGGIRVSNGGLYLERAEIRGNDAAANDPGGGIFAQYSTVTIDQSTIRNNVAGAGSVGGGGVFSYFSNVYIQNSSILNNAADVYGGTNGKGGGIHAFNGNNVFIVNSTVAQNSAPLTGGIYGRGVSSNFFLTNSLISGNQLFLGATTSGIEINNASIGGTVYANDNNLFADAAHNDAEAFVGFTPGANDINASSDGIDAAINSIVSKYSYGSLLPLVQGSPAVDAGNTIACASNPINGIDQRGELRDDIACDIGAIELRDANLVIDNLGDAPVGSDGSCNLRNAIASASSGVATGGCPPGKANNRIDLGAVLGYRNAASGTVTLLSPLPQITADISLESPEGTNLVIDANNTGRVLDISGATVNLTSLTLRGGSTSGDGGAINAQNNSVVSINAVDITANSAALKGGGIQVTSSSLEVSKSIIHDNFAANFGGGIYSSDGTISFANSTLSGNSATADGGGMDLAYTTLTMTNSTVTANTATTGVGGGIDAFNDSVVNLRNSIVSGNIAGAATDPGYEISDFNGSATFNLDAYNLFGNASLSNATAFRGVAPGSSDINATSDDLNVATASILSPLDDNGGPTLTHALPIGSPALSAANSFFCGDPAINYQDQRGLLRTSYCDIGAFELQRTAVITVNSPLDTFGNATVCTLRDAFFSASYNRPYGGCAYGDSSEIIEFDNAVFPAGANNSIALTSSLPNITNTTVTINGSGSSGLTIDASSMAERGLYAYRSNVTFNNINITGATQNGISAQYSTLTLNSASIVNNSATVSGGAGIRSYRGELILNESTVADNSTGTYTYGGNSYVISGGGIYAVYSIVTLSNSTVSGNTASGSGAAISTRYGSISLINSTVSSNIAERAGGGLNMYSGDLTLIHATISGNTAGNMGGALRVRGYVNATLVNSLITGNRAAQGAEIEAPSDLSFGGLSTVSNNNLFGDSANSSTQAFMNFTPGPFDINATSSGTNARLGSILKRLTNNGGPTLTNALVENSPALNAGDGAVCGIGQQIEQDQRGEARNDGACDLGSFEGFVIDQESLFVVPLANGKVVIFSL